MVFNLPSLLNFLVQISLVIALFFAVSLARKRKLDRHCLLMNIVVPVQIASAAIVMVPSLIRYSASQPLFPWLFAEFLLHGILGVLIIGIWGYVNLAQLGVVPLWGRLRTPMRTAFVLWLATFAIGIHIFVTVGIA